MSKAMLKLVCWLYVQVLAVLYFLPWFQVAFWEGAQTMRKYFCLVLYSELDAKAEEQCANSIEEIDCAYGFAHEEYIYKYIYILGL
jgi:hypothetical protein